MSLPDKDQVREALEGAEGMMLHKLLVKAEYVEPMVAVARAFVDGELIPGEPDYETGARITRELTSLLPVQFEGSHDATLWTVKIVDAALGGRQVTGREEK